VITGGATGIGRAAAKRFIEEGAFVFIFGRRQEALDAAVADLGPNVRAVKGATRRDRRCPTPSRTPSFESSLA
jgi:NAD(P)-dependent dehydrogenase (short-subunit alcohol dehydrogenase family)